MKNRELIMGNYKAEFDAQLKEEGKLNELSKKTWRR